ncbi:hypothetical protein CERSUDRAFT_76411 [Gelatoporia subvermispora B]|uniref:Uncharacterized protein n=1 Tax=Ceriporiopsis subvermispora (strain B) TaxID=914234 RepID=M2Q9X6_CERS8|nr:hypothetical protein CERSUDRAFT_76411 [Gelatoporia subvermispora B]
MPVPDTLRSVATPMLLMTSTPAATSSNSLPLPLDSAARSTSPTGMYGPSSFLPCDSETVSQCKVEQGADVASQLGNAQWTSHELHYSYMLKKSCNVEYFSLDVSTFL